MESKLYSYFVIEGAFLNGCTVIGSHFEGNTATFGGGMCTLLQNSQITFAGLNFSFWFTSKVGLLRDAEPQNTLNFKIFTK